MEAPFALGSLVTSCWLSSPYWICALCLGLYKPRPKQGSDTWMPK